MQQQVEWHDTMSIGREANYKSNRTMCINNIYANQDNLSVNLSYTQATRSNDQKVNK